MQNQSQIVHFDSINDKVTKLVFVFHAGAVYGSKEKQGVAHLLEHLMFSAHTDVLEKLDKLGVYYNAYTSYKLMCFEFSFLNEDIYDVIDILVDFFTTPNLSDSILNNEKSIVIDEYLMSQRDLNNLFYYEVIKDLYPESYFNCEITGDKESVESITSSDVIDFYNQFLQLSSCQLFICSQFDDLSIFDVLGLSFKHSNSSPSLTQKLGPLNQHPLISKQILPFNSEDNDTVYFALGFEVPFLDVKYLLYLDLLAEAMSGSLTSLMFKQIRQALGGVYALSADTLVFDDKLVFMAFTSAPMDSDYSKHFLALADCFETLLSEKFLHDNLPTFLKAIKRSNYSICTGLGLMDLDISYLETSNTYSYQDYLDALNNFNESDFISFISSLTDMQIIASTSIGED